MPGEYSQQTLEAHFKSINERLARIESQVALVSRRLDIPFEEPAAKVPPEVVELARAGKTLDAVKRYRELTDASFDEARAVVVGL